VSLVLGLAICPTVLASGSAKLELRGLRDDRDRTGLQRAAAAALDRLSARRRSDPLVRSGLRTVTALPGDVDLGAALADRFVASAPTPILLTGYYEASLRAREQPEGPFRHPIYRLPTGSNRRARRAEIDAGVLAGRGLELFWTDDPIELFFLHVQGSGRLDLGGGKQARLAFAGSNDQPYRSIGSDLLRRGVFASAEKATAPAIKDHLRDEAKRLQAILQANPRYIYFRVIDAPAEEGPPGALGAPLVPYRSVAVDPKVAPLGSVGILRATLPDDRQLETLVVAMDTGAAIRGPGRIDLFMGSDAEAQRLAGRLRTRGTMTWLRPRRP
jgi:membrane-bound lytic murein transglycosylase A